MFRCDFDVNSSDAVIKGFQETMQADIKKGGISFVAKTILSKLISMLLEYPSQEFYAFVKKLYRYRHLEEDLFCQLVSDEYQNLGDFPNNPIQIAIEEALETNHDVIYEKGRKLEADLEGNKGILMIFAMVLLFLLIPKGDVHSERATLAVPPMFLACLMMAFKALQSLTKDLESNPLSQHFKDQIIKNFRSDLKLEMKKIDENLAHTSSLQWGPSFYSHAPSNMSDNEIFNNNSQSKPVRRL